MFTYQERYLRHQQRKKESLTSNFGTQAYEKFKKKDKDSFAKITEARRSQRVFNGKEITEQELAYIEEAIRHAPSSCDRKAILSYPVKSRERKELLGGMLVGGVGWIHRADTIILLFADMEAYVNPIERDFMPYLDAGVIIQQVYLSAEVQNIGCCYVNPNIRDQNKHYFEQRFGKGLFCGALALGKYTKKAIK